MVAGRLTHYRCTPNPLGHTMAHASDTPARLGDRAEPWFAVWVSNDRLATFHGHLAACYTGTNPLRIRPITWKKPDFLL